MGYFKVEPIDSREHLSTNRISEHMVFEDANSLYNYCVKKDIVMIYYKVIEFVCTSNYEKDNMVLGFCSLSDAFNNNLKSLNFNQVSYGETKTN